MKMAELPNLWWIFHGSLQKKAAERERGREGERWEKMNTSSFNCFNFSGPADIQYGRAHCACVRKLIIGVCAMPIWCMRCVCGCRKIAFTTGVTRTDEYIISLARK